MLRFAGFVIVAFASQDAILLVPKNILGQYNIDGRPANYWHQRNQRVPK
jgi:hypothetical protein